MTRRPRVRTPASGLTVFYDDHCPLCLRCAGWLTSQPTRIPMRVVPSSSVTRREGVFAYLTEELVVLTDEGDAYLGADAFLVCLWAIDGCGWASKVLTLPGLVDLSKPLLKAMSAERHRIGTFIAAPSCDHSGTCRLPQHAYR